MASVTENLTWDPLEAAGTVDANILASAKKREIKNILKSYVSNYDPLSELIQNAMDAVEKRFSSELSECPKVKVVVNLQENSIEVIDNGCGFEESEFRSFLAPSISFKSGGATRGNKGVGVTYIAYGFNDLTIRTKNNFFTYEGVMRRGREWIEDQAGTVARPIIEPAKTSSSAFDALEQGTSFKISFSGKHVRPSNLSWYKARTASQWLYLLLIKTPLGSINLPDCSPSNIHFDLDVIDEAGALTSITDELTQYKFPHNEIKASQQLRRIVAAQQKALDAGKDPSKAIDKFRKSNGIYETYTCDQALSLARLSEEERSLAESLNLTAYGYFVYSTEVWDQLNDKKAGLRKGLRILRGGLQIASNKMPQGEIITIPLTKSIGHQNQSHVIVHFDGAEPDLGRKGFQPELKELAEKVAVGIVRQLSARREDILKSDSGAQTDIDKEIKVHEWLKRQEQHEVDCPLVLKSDKFFLPTRKISVMCVPQSEQDVIVLFNQLIAGGVIRGLKLLSTSQSSQYDGVFRFSAEDPLADYSYDKERNPLGVYEEQLTKTYRTQPKVLEYKFCLDGLIREFEAGDKHENDVDLAIFWDMGKEFEKEYSVISYLDEEKTHHRTHHGLTHRLNSANSHIEVICLQELFQLLNDPAAAQEMQEALYGDDL
ncbi:ATP-binding protein [Rhodovulum sulfidophilum]|uniref:ATP-binding protein n=1 Tax=Rhodovulum visakhapatnamense TaxID=364297 RepID=A0ABS1RLK1_9RHOB|nr:ATP-binding protein [Rhodovulum visakhapatnamense]MBL3571840.1 ATP-binding protein [Rhodovulum visakhapatnamense]MBL3580384.1 ATP-binding protein [Rhodovulum visakhapatnamense]OLS45386.1 ATP-binding protein [Rhodovulum sulfidophilum]